MDLSITQPKKDLEDQAEIKCMQIKQVIQIFYKMSFKELYDHLIHFLFLEIVCIVHVVFKIIVSLQIK